MIVKQLLPSVVCIAILAGCATTAQQPSKPMSMASALADAEAASRAGQHERAYEILKIATISHPTDKTPWLRMAQMRFDDKSYGEAIVSGLAAIERDPDDMLAYSLVAVSGRRVSSKALGDLTQKNGFSGSVRSEAQDLANLLRNTLGEKTLVKSAPAPAPKNLGRPAAAAPSTRCSGPFCG
jgi:predicted Zn-dependent protease